MSLPSNLQTITLTGTYLDTTGVPLSGTISFTPPPELVDVATAIMYAAPVTATLDSSGHFSVLLICTDNGTLAPAGWSYTVVEAISGNRSYTIYVPHSLGSTVDLSSLVPLPDLTGAPVPTTVAAVAPGYGALAYSNAWTGLNAFTGEVTVPSPVNATDAVTKQYADAIALGLSVKPSVQESSAAALSANTYANGAAGVGATLTANANGALSLDGVAVTAGDRVLVMNEAAGAHNGIYQVTAAGSSVAPYVLTRTADMNTASELPGAFVFVEQGTANGGSGFVVANAGPFTVGTTAVSFSQFSGAGTNAGTGLSRSGSTLSLSVPVSLADGGTGSITQNFVDLTTTQTAAGNKTFTGILGNRNVTKVINAAAAPYNADPTGVADSTAAINSAVSAAHAAGGAAVYLPAGVYKVTPVSTTVAAIVLNNGSAGFQGVRLIGDSQAATVIKRATAGPILSMSGPASDTSGVTHCRYCSVENIALHGNSLTGTLVQLYYADTLLFENVHIESSSDVGVDCAEFWDSRFYNVLFDSCGSTTANTVAPNLWLRNSAATSGFGYSAGTINNLYFFGCRWEQYMTGAVRIERGLGTNVGQPYSLYFVSSKFETAQLNGGATFFCDTTARDIHLHKAHTYIGGFYGSYGTAQDAYTFGPQFGSLRDILIFNSTAAACVANGVTVNAPLSGATVTIQDVRGSYTGGATPTGAHINLGTVTGTVVLDDCTSDNGTLYSASIPSATRHALITSSDSLFIGQDGSLKWGPGGGAAVDASWSRSGAGAMYAGANVTIGGTGYTTGVHTHAAGTIAAAPVLTPAFANAVASRLSDLTHDYMIYLTVGTAGSAMTIAIGPTSTPANTIVSSSVAASGEVYAFRLPAGWYVQWSATTATLANQKAIGC